MRPWQTRKAVVRPGPGRQFFFSRPAPGSVGVNPAPTCPASYLGARAYDPRTSQFITPGPVLNPADPRTSTPTPTPKTTPSPTPTPPD